MFLEACYSLPVVPSILSYWKERETTLNEENNERKANHDIGKEPVFREKGPISLEKGQQSKNEGEISS
jgi:hypothetical protein